MFVVMAISPDPCQVCNYRSLSLSFMFYNQPADRLLHSLLAQQLVLGKETVNDLWTMVGIPTSYMNPQYIASCREFS